MTKAPLKGALVTSGLPQFVSLCYFSLRRPLYAASVYFVYREQLRHDSPRA